MNYHKLTKKLKKLEKKFPDYTIIAMNKREVVTTSKGTQVFHENITKLPRIYNYLQDVVDYNRIKKDILEIIGE